MIDGSEIELISNGNGKNTVNTSGPVVINDSEVYLSSKGAESSGLYATSTVDISGDSNIDMDGTLAATEAVTACWEAK